MAKIHTEGAAGAETWVECRLLALLNRRSSGEVPKSLRLMVRSHIPGQEHAPLAL